MTIKLAAKLLITAVILYIIYRGMSKLLGIIRQADKSEIECERYMNEIRYTMIQPHRDQIHTDLEDTRNHEQDI